MIKTHLKKVPSFDLFLCSGGMYFFGGEGFGMSHGEPPPELEPPPDAESDGEALGVYGFGLYGTVGAGTGDLGTAFGVGAGTGAGAGPSLKQFLSYCR